MSRLQQIYNYESISDKATLKKKKSLFPVHRVAKITATWAGDFLCVCGDRGMLGVRNWSI